MTNSESPVVLGNHEGTVLPGSGDLAGIVAGLGGPPVTRDATIAHEDKPWRQSVNAQCSLAGGGDHLGREANGRER
jgi:hypothetical protein